MKRVKDAIQNALASSVCELVDRTGTVKLQEESYSVELRGVPDGSVVIKTDRLCVEGFVNESSEIGFAKRADYALIDFYNQRITIIELKSRKPNNPDVVRQLKGGRVVVEYVASLISVFGEGVFEYSKYDFRYVLFRKGSGKDSVKPNTSPEMFLRRYRRPDKAVPYSQLASGRGG